MKRAPEANNGVNHRHSYLAQDRTEWAKWDNFEEYSPRKMLSHDTKELLASPLHEISCSCCILRCIVGSWHTEVEIISEPIRQGDAADGLTWGHETQLRDQTREEDGGSVTIYIAAEKGGNFKDSINEGATREEKRRGHVSRTPEQDLRQEFFEHLEAQ